MKPIPEIAIDIMAQNGRPYAPDQEKSQKEKDILVTFLNRLHDFAELQTKGTHCIDWWAVTYYKLHRFLSIVLKVLIGAGLLSLSVNPGQLQASAPGGLILASVALLLNIASELYKDYGVGEIAQEAILTRKGFKQLAKTAEVGMRDPDPSPAIGSALDDGDDLEQRHIDLFHLPRQNEVDDLFSGWVAKYSRNWSTSTMFDNYEKPENAKPKGAKTRPRGAKPRKPKSEKGR